MLNRLYVDNFRCLVNFELNFEDRVSLLMGSNGAGKTTVFDVLRDLQRFVHSRAQVSEVFDGRNLTRWQSGYLQTFELGVNVSGQGVYAYRLVLEYLGERRQHVRVREEKLSLPGQPLYETKWSESPERAPVLTGVVYSEGRAQPVEMPIPWSQSGVGFLANVERSDNQKLRTFVQALSGWVIVHPAPFAAWMETDSRKEQSQLDGYAKNFPSWYRHLLQDHTGNALELMQELRVALPGFESLNLKESGEGVRSLKVKFKTQGTTTEGPTLDFNELSDGQRMLILLYTLLVGLHGQNKTLFIDEPDNFLALSEVQPWLTELLDRAGESFVQAVLISHHPEIFDGLGASQIQHLVRDDAGPVRVTGAPTAVDGLSRSQTIARGWEV